MTLNNPEGYTNYRWNDGTEVPKTIPWSIAKAAGPDTPPEGLMGFAPSGEEESDGRIIGVDMTMEYAEDADFTDPIDCTGLEITGLKAGTYYVRVRETDTHKAGAAALVSVPVANNPIIATSEGFSGPYDGQKHDIKVTVENTDDDTTVYTILYGKDPTQCNLTESSVIENVEDSPLTVYYRITAEGYDERAGSETIEILPAYPDMTPPRAIERLIYSGARQELVTAGSVDSQIATLYYAKTTELTPPEDEDDFTVMVPKARDAGTWYVWYKAVVKDEYRGNYKDTNLTAIAVTMEKPETVEAAFRLPGQGVEIEASAFEGNTRITEVDARGCTAIGAGAFRGCTGLNQIQLPRHCVSDSTAFEGCGTVYVFAPEGGRTEQCCYGIPNCVFVEITGE